jgi:hypothetical protein
LTEAVQLFRPINNDQEDVTTFFRRDAAIVRKRRELVAHDVDSFVAGGKPR